jgi:hypothetical protein
MQLRGQFIRLSRNNKNNFFSLSNAKPFDIKINRAWHILTTFMKKIYFLLLIILCLLLIVGGFLFYKNYSAKPLKKTPNQAVFSDVNQWPQYTNLNFDYSIRYPNQWGAIEEHDDYCFVNDNSPCDNYVFLRATSTTPVQIVVFFNKRNLSLLDWLSDKGHDVKECQTTELNNLSGVKCGVSYYFKKGEYVYNVSGINPDYFMGDYRNNQQQEFIDEMEKVIPANALPVNFYSTAMTDEQLLFLEEKIVAKVASTFMLLEK